VKDSRRKVLYEMGRVCWAALETRGERVSISCGMRRGLSREGESGVPRSSPPACAQQLDQRPP